MPAQNGLALHILQAELAHVEPPQAGVFLWVWRVVPGVQLVAAKHDGLYHVAAFWHLACQTKLLLYMPGQEGKGDGDGRKGTTRTGRQGRRAGRGERGENGKISVSQGWGSAEHRTSVEATMHKVINSFKMQEEKLGWGISRKGLYMKITYWSV